MRKRIVVGMSGGVDSSVVAKLLVDQGHEVVGVFLKNWEEDGECEAVQDLTDAERVAQRLGIEFHVKNFSKEYWADVFEYFLKANKAYRTPNPDILCNKFIKFGVFLDFVDELGGDALATGHYAGVEKNEMTGKFELLIPKDEGKDQTYFLHALNQSQLSRARFPLANYTKQEVRQRAKDWGFLNASKKDSTGICFIGKRNYFDFLKRYIASTPGDMVTDQGKKVGTHQGLSFYTLGQRRNLMIGGVRGAGEAPWFVVEKRVEKNELVVSQDETLLDKDFLTVFDLHWISGEAPSFPLECEARVRYRQTSQKCRVERAGAGYKVFFETPQRAITPGQSVVFYQGKVCLGGGEID